MAAKVAKILITGTGRSGTTFLNLIFTYLKFNTGYDPTTVHNEIYISCRAGLEHKHIGYFEYLDVIKAPQLYNMIPIIAQEYELEVICPMRNLQDTAISRVKNGDGNGGLWNADNLTEQIAFNKHVIETIAQDVADTQVTIIYPDFAKFTSCSKYLYEQLQQIKLFQAHNISYDDFVVAYERARKYCAGN